MANKKIRLLLVEDDRVDQMAFERLVSNKKLPYVIHIAGSVLGARNLIASHDFDVIIADYLLGDGTFFDLMNRVEDVPIIVTTGAGSEETAVKAMKAGAYDYLIKDSRGNYLHTLPLVVKRALKRKQDEEELRNYREQLESLVKERTAKLEAEITERKQAEEKFRTSEMHLRSLMESATNFAVYRLVSDDQSPGRLRVVFVSPSIKDILGIQEPMKFEKWFENIHPEDVEQITAANLKAFKTYRFNEEYRAFNKSRNEWRWIHAVSTGVQDEKGWNRYVNGIVIDVTEKYKAYEKLKNSEKNLKIKTENLIEMNAALNALIEVMKTKETEIQEQVTANMQNLVLPYLERLKSTDLDSPKKTLIEIAKLNLNKVTENFAHRLSSSLYSLTSTEIKVANLIKLGNTTKEIAMTLGISPKTVESHRERIRKKLGISGQKINLRTRLRSIE